MSLQRYLGWDIYKVHTYDQQAFRQQNIFEKYVLIDSRLLTVITENYTVALQDPARLLSGWVGPPWWCNGVMERSHFVVACVGVYWTR
jgi:hypothetical protein